MASTLSRAKAGSLGGVLLLVFVSPVCARADTFVVLPDGTGDFPTIQSALDGALPGDTIELGDGTFRGDGNRDLDYGSKDLTVRSQSGDPALCVIDCEGSPTDPHRGFHFHSGEGPDAALEAVTITHGFQDVAGAILLENGVGPAFRHCVFLENEGDNAHGAVLCDSGTTSTFSNCVFRRNVVGFGSAGAVGVFGPDNSVTFTDCLFEENSTPSTGGALAVTRANEAPVFFERCTFAGNTGDSGGAIILYGFLSCFAPRETISFVDCAFSDNAVTNWGGAVYESFATADFLRCQFERNTAGLQGGAAYSICGDYAFTSTQFLDNRAGGGGAVRPSEELRLVDCVFSGNRAIDPGLEGSGGAIRSNNAMIFATNCLFHDNTAVGQAGGILADFFNVMNCTFVGNVPSAIATPGFLPKGTRRGSLRTIGNTIVAYPLGQEGIVCGGPYPVEVRCSDLVALDAATRSSACVDGGANFSADPLFCDPANGDFAIRSDSPCAPPGVTGCGLVGALPVRCGPTSVEKTSWGAIKARYRRGS